MRFSFNEDAIKNLSRKQVETMYAGNERALKKALEIFEQLHPAEEKEIKPKSKKK